MSALTSDAGRAYRDRQPSMYDCCPKCGELKRTHSKLCRSCWRQKPRQRPSTRPNTGRVWAQTNIPLADACERCGNETRIERHHIDGNPLNNGIGNIAFLCRRCHMDVDGRLHGRLRVDSHCRNGHERTAENTYISPAGARSCRICKKLWWREKAST